MDPNQQPQQPYGGAPQPAPGQPLPPLPSSAPQPVQPSPGQMPGTPPAAPQNPYAFITDPAPVPKRSFGFGGGAGNGLRGRLLVVGGIGVVLIIVAITAGSLINRKPDNAVVLQGLLAEQQEIIRIATYGTTESRDANTLNFATTALEAIASDQVKLTGYLTSKNVKTSAAQLALKKNTATDDKLAAAQQQNNFDPVFVSTLVTMLNTYLTNAQAAYNNASNENSKQILADSYNSMEILAKFYGKTAAQ